MATADGNPIVGAQAITCSISEANTRRQGRERPSRRPFAHRQRHAEFDEANRFIHGPFLARLDNNSHACPTLGNRRTKSSYAFGASVRPS
jgi:hypothetical protein